MRLQLNTSSNQRTGYPTQKPLALLNRIIKASSNEGDIILDPFCGCATACVAAEILKRQWIGIDISPLAEKITKHRLSKRFSDWNTESEVIITSTPPRTDTNVPSQIKLPNYKVHKKFLYGEQEGYCNGCKDHFKIRNLNVDHIIPRSKNGTDHPKNLQLLCQACNSAKATGTQKELIQKLKNKNII